MDLWLDVNPAVPREDAFCVPIDNFQETYGAVGLGTMSDGMKGVKDFKLAPPKGVNAWSYLKNVMKLSPVDAGALKFGEIPEGVMRLGGTFVLRRMEDGSIEEIYRHEDKVPGDHPSIEEVLKYV
ncbi:hypothetical protein TrRE_jg8932 [Triparma retinervis]|uniref:Uncharacterized protein n=1 Tax=Triparma retinervis TaxID=2557542 RepID=A0A9W7DWC6_9STRA|nr:hypothetical protein TrRE_jg8932 [Triparma retinervis]